MKSYIFMGTFFYVMLRGLIRVAVNPRLLAIDLNVNMVSIGVIAVMVYVFYRLLDFIING